MNFSVVLYPEQLVQFQFRLSFMFSPCITKRIKILKSLELCKFSSLFSTSIYHSSWCSLLPFSDLLLCYNEFSLITGSIHLSFFSLWFLWNCNWFFRHQYKKWLEHKRIFLHSCFASLGFFLVIFSSSFAGISKLYGISAKTW